MQHCVTGFLINSSLSLYLVPAPGSHIAGDSDEEVAKWIRLWLRTAGLLLLSACLPSELPGPGPPSLALPHRPAHPRVEPGQPGHHARQGHPRQGRPSPDLNSGDTLEALWKALINGRVVFFHFVHGKFLFMVWLKLFSKGFKVSAFRLETWNMFVQ